MNKSPKFKYLPVFALILGASVAVATKSPEGPKSALATQWRRVASSGTAAGTWQQSSDGTCQSSDKICKAQFPDGYDPSTHSESENSAAAISGTVELGYVPL